MESKITRIEFDRPREINIKRVAAYARVSTGKEAMLHSLAAQVNYYSDLIAKHPGWLYCGVYADEAISGTKNNRENFNKLVDQCRAGNLDMVITKSISRFARNTVTLLETVRELKSLGVDVFFEEQNIHTISSEGELMLTILASYAQEEARSASLNQKWRIQKNFEQGLPAVGYMLGYRMKAGVYVIVPEEAATVRRIYDMYLSGMGYTAICKTMNDEGVSNRDGTQWQIPSLVRILSNYCYTGNLLLQRRYKDSYLTKRSMVNRGELPMYHAMETHEAIISLETFNAVQAERERRSERFYRESDGSSPFSRKLLCGCCGATYRRKAARNITIWLCRTMSRRGKVACPSSKAVPESVLMDKTAEVLGMDKFDPAVFAESVDHITAEVGNTLIFTFTDGTEQSITWQDRSRSESWTPEMKETARQRTIQQRRGAKCQET